LILNHEAELPKLDPIINHLQFNKSLFDLILKEKVFFNFEFSTFSSTKQEKGYSWSSMVAERFPNYKFNIQDYIFERKEPHGITYEIFREALLSKMNDEGAKDKIQKFEAVVE